MPFDTTNGLTDEIGPWGSRTDPYDGGEPDTSMWSVALELLAWAALSAIMAGCVWLGWGFAQWWGL